MKLKWINKYSGETGFVGKMSIKNKYFVNAETEDKAKSYKSKKSAEKDIFLLAEFGENENNDFVIVE